MAEYIEKVTIDGVEQSIKDSALVALSDAANAGKFIIIDGDGEGSISAVSLPIASTEQDGVITASDKSKLDGIPSDATNNKGTLVDVKIGEASIVTGDTATIPSASKTEKGVTSLNSETNSNSETEAATPKAVKDVYSALSASLSVKADKQSPAFTGTPTAPTAEEGTSTDQIATTRYVDRAVTGVLTASRVVVYNGEVGTDGDIANLPAKHVVGDMYSVVTAGVYAGEACEVGDLILCTVAGTSSDDSHWAAFHSNVVWEEF